MNAVQTPVDLRELATRAALLGAIQARVKAELDAARRDLEDALRAARSEQGTKGVDVAVPDDLGADGRSTAATVGFNADGKPTVTVAHMEEAVEWVARNHPQFLREVIDPVFLAGFLKGLEIIDGDQVVYPKTGEVIGWARPVAGSRGSMTVRYPSNGQERLLAAWLAGRMPDVEIGALLPAPASPGAGS